MHGKKFCCVGCQTVFELLSENGLDQFYQLSPTSGVRIAERIDAAQFEYLDDPAIRGRLVDYSDPHLTRVTFHVPSIHCIACVWLLENLFRLQPGIGQSMVNFPRKEVAIRFNTADVKLSEVVRLLARLGYEPDLKLSDLEPSKPAISRRLWMQLGFAGFAFGNTMLFSISDYLGLDDFSGPSFRSQVGWLSLVLAIPVVTYSALDYWRAAWVSLQQRLLNIDVPIAAGIAALFAQSCYSVIAGRGDAYFDSLSGLLFFLLLGRLFQQKTYDRLAFDRDYKSFFPLSITRVVDSRRDGDLSEKTGAEERVSLAQLRVGDRLVIRNGELIPADAVLLDGPALIDYSFVTGESEPVEKRSGDYIYAGGRQTGGALEVETVKSVSQSYLTSLWNQDAFRKDRIESLNVLTNTYSQRFTRIVVALAVGAALFWAVVDPAVSLKAFTSILIVACPCALALAAPFASGTGQRVLGKRNAFLKNPSILETLAKVDAIVFDKTGTLTGAGAGSVDWLGTPLSLEEQSWLYSMTRHSTHPLAVRVGDSLMGEHFPEQVRSFLETAGGGMEGIVAGRKIRMGSLAWLGSLGVLDKSLNAVAECVSSLKQGIENQDCERQVAGSAVHVAIDGSYRGHFTLSSAVRRHTDRLLSKLSHEYELALLSGDNDQERCRFVSLFGSSAQLHFKQSPLDKLEFIRRLQKAGKTVMMVGDGLNDAGALKQSDVGVAVVENIGTFSPASDVIIESAAVARISEMLKYSKQCVQVVRAAFVISSIYNVIGIAIAGSARLSPVVCAVLMPLSSVTVVAFACGAVAWCGRQLDHSEARNSAMPRPPAGTQGYELVTGDLRPAEVLT